MRYRSFYDSPVGRLTLASDGQALVGLWFEDHRYDEESPETIGISVDECPALAQTARWLDLYFAGRRPSPDPLPLAPSGTPFRQAVWRILLEIPYGETTSYGAIASRMAREQGVEIISARAVGGAVGHNPISLIIPCHRVIGKHGDLTGFGGGLDRKRWLLIHEGVLAKEK